MTLTGAIRLSLLAGLSLAAFTAPGMALAQDGAANTPQSDADPDADPDEMIIVTGSRLSVGAPVGATATVLGRAEIEQSGNRAMSPSTA